MNIINFRVGFFRSKSRAPKLKLWLLDGIGSTSISLAATLLASMAAIDPSADHAMLQLMMGRAANNEVIFKTVGVRDNSIIQCTKFGCSHEK
jgi:hypothetical protein